jgi:integration host factor subunit alpha
MELAVESIDSPALTKAQLADLLFDEIGLNKREAKDMVDAFFDLISQKLVEGEDVKLSGFGNFQIRTKARPGRNPRTGELIPIAARRVVTFHASSKLKELIQGEVRGHKLIGTADALSSWSIGELKATVLSRVVQVLSALRYIC